MRVLLLILALFSVSVNADTYPPYDRKEHFGYGWKDMDGDCQNTREEVLIRDSLIPVTYYDGGCKVLTGLWVCPLSGAILTLPGDIDIDHVVPLREAYESGGYKWTKEKRVLYYNDLSDPKHLQATHYSANRSKGHRDPAQWMPSNVGNWPWYITTWTSIKERWELNIDPQEQIAIDKLRTLGEDMYRGIMIRFKEDGTLWVE